MALSPGRIARAGGQLIGVAASATLLGLYARFDIAVLGFVALVPWLIGLERIHSLRAALCSGWAMSIAFVLAVFGWFAEAVALYTGVAAVWIWLLLALLAPLLQPQVWLFAAGQQMISRVRRPILSILAAASTWVAAEWWLPKLFADTLGHGLAPAVQLRQAADLGGAAGLTLLLLLVNLALSRGLIALREGWRTWLPPMLVAALLPLLMTGYGAWRIADLGQQLSEPAPGMRIGMVQSAITDYQGLREERGSFGAVREILDVHFALSTAALRDYQVDALLWSETVYPTPFGHPRSANGAALDAEIQAFVDTAEVPLIFGSYDLDPQGEYNAAVFLEPQAGLLGYYRKTHPFPLTERVPGWLDGPLLRRWLPWTGTWQAGEGVRVLPLRTRDGRNLDVVPLICLDAVDPKLAIEGARLGAQAIVTLSNDSWFASDPIGAALHLRVAVFRSIETRMPQLRVTSSGLSAFIDPSGEVLARSAMGDRAVLAGEVPIQAPPATLMVSWGDWVGAAASGLLALLAAARLVSARRWKEGPSSDEDSVIPEYVADSGPTAVALYSRWQLWLVLLLRAATAGGLVALAAGMLWRYGMQVNDLAQIQLLLWGVLGPLMLGWLLSRQSAAVAQIEGQCLKLIGTSQHWEIPLASIATVRMLPLPLAALAHSRMPLSLQLRSGRRFERLLSPFSLPALLAQLRASGVDPVQLSPAQRFAARFLSARQCARHPWLDHSALRFGLFPLLMALPAFRLHQMIAYGGTFGEWQSHGAQAWFSGLLIWWGAWCIGLMLCAALLRVLIEAIALAGAVFVQDRQRKLREIAESAARMLYYLGVPAALLLRMLG